VTDDELEETDPEDADLENELAKPTARQPPFATHETESNSDNCSELASAAGTVVGATVVCVELGTIGCGGLDPDRRGATALDAGSEAHPVIPTATTTQAAGISVSFIRRHIAAVIPTS
jgi:hypothetical protein